MATGQASAQGQDRLNIRDVGNGADVFTITSDGKVGIGTTSPGSKPQIDAPDQLGLHVAGSNTGVGAAISLSTTNAGTNVNTWEILATGDNSAQGPDKLTIRHINTGADIFAIHKSGSVTVSGDIVMPAADFAEDFAVEASDAIEPSTVVSLDRNGVLRASDKSHDKKAAGVVSGAGDCRPGSFLTDAGPRLSAACRSAWWAKSSARLMLISARSKLDADDLADLDPIATNTTCASRRADLSTGVKVGRTGRFKNELPAAQTDQWLRPFCGPVVPQRDGKSVYIRRSERVRWHMCDMRVCSPGGYISKATIILAFLASAFISPALAADVASVPDLSGQWGRDSVFFEPPPSGPGPVAQTVRRADGVIDFSGAWVGDASNPILKAQAAEAVRKFGELALRGNVVPDLHNRCWPEPPPFALGAHFGVLIIQQSSEVTLIYLLQNTVRHVHLNARHPANVARSWQGDSIGWYEGDTLVIDTMAIKAAPISTVDMLGTPHSEALHVVERYRLIDGKAAAEAERRHGIITRMPGALYGRGPLDLDVNKKGLQVEFIVEDPNVFTTPWKGLVTYRPVIGDWPESLCADNPDFDGSDAAQTPTATRLDF